MNIFSCNNQTGFAFVVLLCAAITVGAWVGLGTTWGISFLIFYAIMLLSLGGWMRFGRGDGDIAAISAGRSDERQHLLDIRAGYFAGMTAIVGCLIGAAVQLADGNADSPLAMICAAAGIAYVAALVVLTRRGA